MPARRDRAIAGEIEAWFRQSARAFPWRTGLAQPRDPYATLVSETMAQQTQIARVVERFTLFMDRFPTIQDLAAAHEDDVLALWSGLGYYRRARNLHAAARAVVDRHDGRFPTDPDDILNLPGVGPYTAGAIASLAFGQREPIVDGNVSRVLLRLDARDGSPTDSQTANWSWDRARALVNASENPAILNEGVMELGATVCTPRSPACDACPVRRRCAARRAGLQHDIPAPKRRAQRQPLFCATALIRRDPDLVIVEQRPPDGMWGSMWQAPTIERADRPTNADELARALAVDVSPEPLAEFTHITTHRDVRFAVWLCELPADADPPRGRWSPTETVRSLALSRPQRRILLEL